MHEQILPALKRAGVPLDWTDITVRHTGYADRALRSRKLDRDSRILREELAERPDDPFTLFNLGSIAIERAEWNDALGYLKRSLAGSAPTDSIVRKLFALIARAHQMLGDFQSALQTCAEGLSLDAEDAELWFRKAVVHRHSGEPAEAEQCWRRILTLSRPEKFASLDQGIYGHLTRRNLAALATERGDLEEAQRQWQAVLAECPGDREALALTRRVRHCGPSTRYVAGTLPVPSAGVAHPLRRKTNSTVPTSSAQAGTLVCRPCDGNSLHGVHYLCIRPMRPIMTPTRSLSRPDDAVPDRLDL